jgi:hypothetical protein
MLPLLLLVLPLPPLPGLDLLGGRLLPVPRAQRRLGSAARARARRVVSMRQRRGGGRRRATLRRPPLPLRCGRRMLREGLQLGRRRLLLLGRRPWRRLLLARGVLRPRPSRLARAPLLARELVRQFRLAGRAGGGGGGRRDGGGKIQAGRRRGAARTTQHGARRGTAGPAAAGRRTLPPRAAARLALSTEA